MSIFTNNNKLKKKKKASLRTGGILLPRNIIFLLLVLISVRGCVNHWGLVWLEGLSKLKKFNSSDLEPATFQLVA
jgi:hypothetical protein